MVRFEISWLHTVLIVRKSRDLVGNPRSWVQLDELHQYAQVGRELVLIVVEGRQTLATIYNKIVGHTDGICRHLQVGDELAAQLVRSNFGLFVKSCG